MAVDPFRFLGLAFATADLLFEVDGAGKIVFAAGAGHRIAGANDAELIGRPWLELFDETDRFTAEALMAGLVDGQRRGLFEIVLAADGDSVSRSASLSMFKLPQIAPRISCAMTLVQGPGSAHKPRSTLFGRTEFEDVARGLIDSSLATGPELELGLIAFGGLERERQKLSNEDAKVLDQRVVGALRAEAFADAAADLGQQRFAVMRRKGDSSEALVGRLARVLGAGLEPSAQLAPVDGANSPGRMIRALRFALDRFIADGGAADTSGLSEALSRSMREVAADAGAFGAMVEARQFNLVFQPVVLLKDRGVHHHEVLVRFASEQSPFVMIRMAEELDVIQTLDRAVAHDSAKRLRADATGKLRLAVNVSGRTIVNPGFVEDMRRLNRDGELSDRLLFEITESAAISDLALAQRHIKALQDKGYTICLDDFGAGAASFAYLRQLRVDVVKIDGSYVRELTSAGRDDTMIRHLVNLCRELGVETVAEMVETKAVEDVLRRAGVDYAQGWLYGQPEQEPQFPKAAAAGLGRRMGAVEQWG